MNTKHLLAIHFLTFIFLSVVAKGQQREKISVQSVRTQNGFLSGTFSPDREVMVFKGIPYAASPVGNLRWKAPQPVKNWKGIRKAEHFGPNAMQGKPVPFGVYTKEFLIPEQDSISEDCLYLNVWTGAKSSSERRPVIVFIHGGGFVSGSGSVPIYDGTAMAKRGVVFVSINYRLGIFGFYSHPELTKESPHHASGNYGILDQIAALQWVKKNIAAFGGDPDRVTIAGQSAGSMSVNILAASPLARGLFAGMIAESGASVVKGMFGGTMSLDTAEAKGVQFQRTAGAAGLKELRNMRADQLLPLFKGFGNVIVDGYVLPEPVPSLFAKGKQTEVPLLTGYNGDDVLFPTPNTLVAYQEYVKRQFGHDASELMQHYAATNDEEAQVSAKNLARDEGFGVQNFAWAHTQGQRGNAKAYLYFFNRKVPEHGGTSKYGAFHTGEVMYAYDNLKFLDRPLEGTDQQLANLMAQYWVNFASKGNPNGPGLPEWPAYDPQKGEVMIFDAKSYSGKHPFFGGLKFLFSRSSK